MIQVCVLAMAGLFAVLIIRKDKPEFATLIILLVSFYRDKSAWHIRTCDG